jgi:polyisoprenoid-binding protein YceI
MRYRFALVVSGLLAIGPNAEAESWHSVPDNSRLEFVVTWEGEPLEGRFQVFEVALELGSDATVITGLQVRVDVTSLATAMPDVDEALREPDWFFFERYPEARYSARQIHRLGGGRYEAEGTLTLKGLSRPLGVPFTWTRSGVRGRLQGQVPLDRSAFRIGEGDWATGDPVGLEVQVRFDLELVP